MYQLIEWLIFHLPKSGYEEAGNTAWVSWDSGWGLSLGITYWPGGQASIYFRRWGKSWMVD